MVDPESIAEARRVLGRQLAQCRRAAGHTQATLAPLTGYGRSTIANVEVGRQNVPRCFWECCEGVLGARGGLLSAYDALETLTRQHHEKTTYLLQTRRVVNADIAQQLTLARSVRAAGAGEDLTTDGGGAGGSGPDVLSPLGGAELVRRGLDNAINGHTGAQASLDDWERVVLHHGRASRDRPAALLLTDLTVDLADLRWVLSRRQSASAFRRLTRVTAQMAGLMCLTLIKLDERAAFRRWARTARVAATEAGDPVTCSWVRAQEAHGYYYAGEFAEAMQVARHAQDLAGHNRCVGVVLAAALEARADAALGRDREARDALRRAETALSYLDSNLVVPSACGYDEAQLRFHEENALTNLHDTHAALRAQERALDLYPASDYLDRTLVRLDRARCLAYDGDITTAMSCATQAVAELTDQQRRGIITLRAREIVRSLPARDAASPAACELRDLVLPAGSEER